MIRMTAGDISYAMRCASRFAPGFGFVDAYAVETSAGYQVRAHCAVCNALNVADVEIAPFVTMPDRDAALELLGRAMFSGCYCVRRTCEGRVCEPMGGGVLVSSEDFTGIDRGVAPERLLAGSDARNFYTPERWRVPASMLPGRDTGSPRGGQVVVTHVDHERGTITFGPSSVGPLAPPGDYLYQPAEWPGDKRSRPASYVRTYSAPNEWGGVDEGYRYARPRFGRLRSYLAWRLCL